MSAKPIKFLFAAVAVACGLGISVGGGWLATADAQQPPAKNDPQAEIKRLQAELDKATRLVQQQAEAARAAERAALADLQKAAEAQRWRAQEVKEKLAEQLQNDSYTAKTTKWEYDFVVISPMDQTRFMKFLQDKENRGWDYHGTTKFIDPKGECWVFRRPAKAAATPKITHLKEDRLFDFTDSARINDAKVVEAEIAKLQHRLNQLQGGRAVITRDQSPLEPGELVELLQKLAEKQPKIGKLRLAVDATTKSVMIEGDAAAVAWAQSVVKKLAEK